MCQNREGRAAAARVKAEEAAAGENCSWRAGHLSAQIAHIRNAHMVRTVHEPLRVGTSEA